MILPDITISDDAILSMQEPYTLNRCIVTSININTDVINGNKMIIIKNENGFNIRIPSDELKEYFTREIGIFIQTHGHNVHIDGRRYINLESYTFDDYINNIISQCIDIDNHTYNSTRTPYINYMNSLRNDVIRQNRQYYGDEYYISARDNMRFEFTSHWVDSVAINTYYDNPYYAYANNETQKNTYTHIIISQNIFHIICLMKIKIL